MGREADSEGQENVLTTVQLRYPSKSCRTLSKDDLFSSFKDFLARNCKEFAIFGSQLTKQGEYERALYHLSLAIALNGGNYLTYYNRAVCYLEIDEPNKALPDAAKCVKLDPEVAEGFLLMGTILSRLKLYLQAELVFQKALQLDPKNMEIEQQIAGNIYDGLIEMGFDPIKAGYASQKYSSIKEANVFLKNNEFEIDLRLTREKKKRQLRKLAFKRGKLVPINFY